MSGIGGEKLFLYSLMFGNRDTQIKLTKDTLTGEKAYSFY